jgi:lysophospholipase L1-like esterase
MFDLDLLFIGDSLTQWWNFEGRKPFEKYFGKYKTENRGVSGDTTKDVLIRLNSGVFENLNPETIILLIGANDILMGYGKDEVSKGIRNVLEKIEQLYPSSKIILLGVFPVSFKPDSYRKTVNEVNNIIKNFENKKHISYFNKGNKFLDENRNIPQNIMSDGVHLTEYGYDIWGKFLLSIINSL